MTASEANGAGTSPDQPGAARYQQVAKTSDIPLQRSLCVELDGHQVLICHIREGFFALENNCSHAGASLSEGRVRGHRVLCPLHGAAFDVRDGAALSRPALRPVQTFPLRVEGDAIMIALQE